MGKSLKKESVAVDVISMGEIEDNKTKLQVGVCNITFTPLQYLWRSCCDWVGGVETDV